MLAGDPGVARSRWSAPPMTFTARRSAPSSSAPEGADLDQATLIAWSQERLAQQKYPRRREVVEALPLGPSCKIRKRELVKEL